MRYALILITAFLGAVSGFSQDVGSYNLKDLQERIHQKNDTTYVVNFWATWCGPCVRELPYFEEFNSMHEDDKIKLLLVSLDFSNSVESRLKPFIKTHKLNSEVIHFTERNPNQWIPEISNKWSGSIPATLIVNDSKGVYQFYERGFPSTEDLEKTVMKLLK